MRNANILSLFNLKSSLPSLFFFLHSHVCLPVSLYIPCPVCLVCRKAGTFPTMALDGFSLFSYFIGTSKYHKKMQIHTYGTTLTYVCVWYIHTFIFSQLFPRGNKQFDYMIKICINSLAVVETCLSVSSLASF